MNQKQQDNKLDELLGRWSDEVSEVPPADFDALQQKIVHRLGDSGEPTSRDSADQKSRSVPLEIRAVAACVLIGLGVAFLLWKPAASALPIGVPEFACLADSDILVKQKLVQKCFGLFGGDFRGAIESRDDFEMNIEDASRSPGSLSTRATVVRLVCARRETDSVTWEHVWARDVIAVEENVFQSPRPTLQLGLVVWAWQMPDGNIITEIDIQGTDAAQLEVEGFHRRILAPNNISKIGCVRSDKYEYCLFQTAAPIPATEGVMHETM